MAKAKRNLYSFIERTDIGLCLWRRNPPEGSDRLGRRLNKEPEDPGPIDARSSFIGVNAVSCSPGHYPESPYVSNQKNNLTYENIEIGP